MPHTSEFTNDSRDILTSFAGYWQATKEDALHAQKILRWSRSLRDEARHTFFASRDSLRALYDLIEIKKAKLIEAREGLVAANTVVKKNRRTLRAMCVKSDAATDSALCRDAETSGDEKCDTVSLTDISSFDEELAAQPKNERVSREL